MTTIKLDLPDDQAQAAAQGLTLEGWIQRIVAQEMPRRPRHTLEVLVAQCDSDAPLSDKDRA